MKKYLLSKALLITIQIVFVCIGMKAQTSELIEYISPYDGSVDNQKEVFYSFSFKTTNYSDDNLKSISPEPFFKNQNYNHELASDFRSRFNLPDDFPALIVTYKNNPLEGEFFVTARSGGNTWDNVNYAIIFDTCGVPLYYQRLKNRGADLRMQPNGYLTQYPGDGSYYAQYDSSYNVMRNYYAASGYNADMHELLIMEDESYWLITKQLHLVDMSVVVPGGNPNATVEENILQHLDSNGNLLWQWNSLDHIPITDCDTGFVDLTSFYIDYIHINAIDFDYDGNILISSRHLNEITKINSTTGNIIWRWGGKANQFTFIYDPEGFYGQHSIRYHGDNYYTLFDNGNFHSTPHSRGLRYELDQQSMVAVLDQVFVPGDTPVYSPAMGHMQKTDNDAYIVGWAANAPGLVLTEFDNNGNKKLEINNYDTTLISYRAYKFPWKTNAFYFNNDTLLLSGFASDTTYGVCSIYNNSDQPLEINGYHLCYDNFFVDEVFPFQIQPFESEEITIGLASNQTGNYNDALTMYSQTNSDSTRIASQIRLIGDVIVSFNETEIINELIVKQSHNLISVSTSNNCLINGVFVYDISGRLLHSKNNIMSSQYEFHTSRYNCDIVFIKVLTDKGSSSKKVYLLN